MRPKKEFDAVQMMRDIRDQLTSEMIDLTPRERIELIERRAQIAREKIEAERAKAA